MGSTAPARTAATVTRPQSPAFAHAESGSAGFSGGILRPRAFQERSSTARVTAARTEARRQRHDVHTWSCLAMGSRYPHDSSAWWRRGVRSDSRRVGRARTARASSSGCREHTSQSGAGSPCRVISTLTARFQDRAGAEVGAGVRLGPATDGYPRRPGPRSARCTASRPRPATARTSRPGGDDQGGCVGTSKPPAGSQRDAAEASTRGPGKGHDEGQQRVATQHHARTHQRNGTPAVRR